MSSAADPGSGRTAPRPPSLTRRVGRALGWLLFGLLALIVLLFALVVFVVQTDTGTRWAVDIARNLLPEGLALGAVEGRLASPLVLRDVEFDSQALQLSIDRISLDWSLLPLLDLDVRIDELAVHGVDIRLRQDPNPEPPSTEPIALPNLPLDIVLERFVLTDLSVQTAADGEALVANRITGRAAWNDERLAIDDLALEAPLLDATGYARLKFPGSLTTVLRSDAQRLAAATLDLKLDYRARPPEVAQILGSAIAAGPLTRLDIQFAAEPPYALGIAGTVTNPLARWGLDLDLVLNGTALQQIRSDLPTMAIDMNTELVGGAAELTLAGEIRARSQIYGRFRSDLALIYSPDRLRLQQLALVELDASDPLELDGYGVIELTGANPIVDVAFDWRRMRWPLVGVAEIGSASGTATVQGQLDDYRARFDAQLAVPNQTDGHLVLRGSGARDHFDLESLDLATLQGTLAGSGRLAWRSGFAAALKLTIAGINPAGLAPQWPGRIDGVVEASFEQPDAARTPTIDVPKLELRGRLRDAALEARVELQLRDDLLRITHGRARLGDNRLQVSGSADLDGKLALAYELDAGELETLLPGAAGRLTARGSLGGNTATPRLQASAQANDLRYQTHSLSQARLVADISLDPGYPNRLSLKVSDFQDPAVAVKTMAFDLTGPQADHRLTLAASSDLGDLTLDLQGASRDLRRFAEVDGSYRFELQSLRFDHAQVPPVRLSSGGSGQLSRSSGELQPTCLRAEDSEICIAGQWRGLDAEPSGQLRTDITGFDFALLDPLLEDLNLVGTLSGGGDLSLTSDGAVGELSFVTTAIELRRSESEFDSGSDSGLEGEAEAVTSDDTLLRLEPGKLALRSSSDALQLSLAAPLAGTGGLHLELQLQPDRQDFAQSGIAGTAKANIPDLTFLAALLPEVSRLEGALVSDLRFSGVLQTPQLDGEVSLADAEVALVTPGITLRKVQLRFQADAGTSDRVPLMITGSAVSGGGTLTLDGTASYSAERVEAQLALQGERFRVVNNEQAEVFASPDLSVALIDQALSLRGKVRVPEAHIKLRSLPQSAVGVSEDQVIMREDMVATTSDTATSVSVDVELLLGEEVHFEGFGLDARFEGDLRIKQAPGEPVLGVGEISIAEGRYEAYGQILKIERGRAIWTDNPIEKPGVDLRAIRKPRDNVVVGVRARGRLSKPEFSLFSEPAMSESDRLSYLVLGRPLEDNSSAESSLLSQAALALGIRGGNFLSEQFGGKLGVDQVGIETEAGAGSESAAFVIGKYLSPKLYVSYGLGLLDSISTLKLEYLMSNRWRLATESSTQHSGGDLIYTIERR